MVWGCGGGGVGWGVGMGCGVWCWSLRHKFSTDSEGMLKRFQGILKRLKIILGYFRL